MFTRFQSGLAATFGMVTLASGLLLAGARPADSQVINLEGSWSGSGTVVFPSGDSEKARCRASFKRQSESRYGMTAVCATPSARVAQTANLSRVSGNRYSGDFHNAEYGVTGSIRIMVQGNKLTAALSGGGASANLNLSR